MVLPTLLTREPFGHIKVWNQQIIHQFWSNLLVHFDFWMQRCLLNFASSYGATVSRCWNPNVTHVIAATDENGACTRTLKVLMAILNGRWILTMDCEPHISFHSLCLPKLFTLFLLLPPSLSFAGLKYWKVVFVSSFVLCLSIEMINDNSGIWIFFMQHMQLSLML